MPASLRHSSPRHRWLTGRTSKLPEWSIFKMSEVLKHIEAAMERLVQDPSLLQDPEFDIFESVAGELPEFRRWRVEMLKEKTVALDGETEYEWHRNVLKSARSPDEGSANHKVCHASLTPRHATRRPCTPRDGTAPCV